MNVENIKGHEETLSKIEKQILKRKVIVVCNRKSKVEMKTDTHVKEKNRNRK